MPETHKDLILKALHWKPLFTTELFMKLQNDGAQIGVKSLTNRCTDLQTEGRIIGEHVQGRAEKRWRLYNGELF